MGASLSCRCPASNSINDATRKGADVMERPIFPRIGFRKVALLLFIMVGANLVFTSPFLMMGFELRWTMFLTNSIGGVIAITVLATMLAKKKRHMGLIVLRIAIAAAISIPLSYLIVYQQ